MVDRVVPGLHPVRELLRAGAPVREVVVARERSAGRVLEDILRFAADAGVPVRAADRADLDRLAGGVVHQGVAARAPAFRYATLDELRVGVRDDGGEELALLVALDGVTDPHNLGSIARTAEAVGAHGLLVPQRRTAGVTPAVEKAAAGALAHLPVARVTNLTRALHDLREDGVWSVGLDADGAEAVWECELLAGPVVVVVGAEGRGLSRLVARTCDELARLPIRGHVASLNASVAAGAALYATRWMRDVRTSPGA